MAFNSTISNFGAPFSSLSSLVGACQRSVRAYVGNNDGIWKVHAVQTATVAGVTGARFSYTRYPTPNWEESYITVLYDAGAIGTHTYKQVINTSLLLNLYPMYWDAGLREFQVGWIDFLILTFCDPPSGSGGSFNQAAWPKMRFIHGASHSTGHFEADGLSGFSFDGLIADSSLDFDFLDFTDYDNAPTFSQEVLDSAPPARVTYVAIFVDSANAPAWVRFHAAGDDDAKAIANTIAGQSDGRWEDLWKMKRVAPFVFDENGHLVTVNFGQPAGEASDIQRRGRAVYATAVDGDVVTVEIPSVIPELVSRSTSRSHEDPLSESQRQLLLTEAGAPATKLRQVHFVPKNRRQ